MTTPKANPHRIASTSWLIGAAVLAASPLAWFSGCQSGTTEQPREFRPAESPATMHLGSHDADTLIRSIPVRPAGAWVPNAVASFVSIDRSTSYALVHDPERAMLIITAAESVDDGNEPVWVGTSTGTNYLWWVVELPNDLASGQAIPLGERHRAWLLERLPGLPTHGSPASGSATIRAISDELLVLDLDIQAPIGRPGAGETVPPAIRTNERISLALRIPVTLSTPEIETGTGAMPRPEPVRLPIWTALGPDEWKPAGWKYEQPGRRRR